MDSRIAAWFQLIGFIGALIMSWIEGNVYQASLKEPDDKRRYQGIVKLKISRKLAWVLLAVQLIVVLQGIHLIHAGYSNSLDLSGFFSESSARIRTKRGFGLFVLTIQSFIKFFPYILITGYSYLSIRSFTLARNLFPSKIKTLELLEEKIQSLPAKEKQKLREALINEKAEKKRAIEALLSAKKAEREKIREALSIEPIWLDDENEEGWIVDTDRYWHKRFYIEKNPVNATSFIFEQTGRAKSNEPPLIKKRIRLTRKEALSDYRHYLRNGWNLSDAKWK